MSSSSTPRIRWRRQTSAARYVDHIIEEADDRLKPALREFAAWLQQRGLAGDSVVLRMRSTSEFMAVVVDQKVSVAEGFHALDVTAIEDFFISYGSSHGRGAHRSMQAAMRLVLRFAASRGWTDSELVGAVPMLRVHRAGPAKPALLDADLVRVLNALNDGTVGSRDKAIILLLATYGVRRGQVANLTFEDVAWRQRTIRFCAQKSGKSVRQALTKAVAVALSRYIKERPANGVPNLFLSHWQPHLPLSPGAITMMVRGQLQRLNIVVRPLGPHIFRHAFASRLLRSGQSMKTIADLLGHRSLSSSVIYAQVGHPRLFEVSTDWPEVQP